MPPTNSQFNIFIIAVILMILVLLFFIGAIFHLYRKRQFAYLTQLEQMKLMHEKDILKTELEIQEQTFQNISREIHDNIGQKLSLAKLHLNTLRFSNPEFAEKQVLESVDIITQSIRDLSDISRSMSTELILNNGLIRALEFEMEQLEKSGIYQIELAVTGESVFLPPQTELLIFRIIQEALNNIIKHAKADHISIKMQYSVKELDLSISDNGTGFFPETVQKSNGLFNMKKRAEMINGHFNISSTPGTGTIINIQIPLHEHI